MYVGSRLLLPGRCSMYRPRVLGIVLYAKATHTVDCDVQIVESSGATVDF
jgi:hypothetical protein